MPKLIYLVHRIPYPPNKGDKIRSYNFLVALAEHYEIYLGCFIDDPEDKQYIGALDSLCKESFCVELQSTRQRVLSLQGLLTGEALSLPFYRNSRMQAWVDKTIAGQNISRALIFSSPMALYVEKYPDINRVADFVDVDSDKWRQYAHKKNWPVNWIYARESEKLLNFERRIASQFNATLLVSEQEAKLFKSLAPEAAEKIGYANNGVDTIFFDPDICFTSPFSSDEQAIVFTGAMDYWANVDAVQWFAEQVFPLIRQESPHIRFYIVGSKPTKTVQMLADANEFITVTGRVEEIRAYLAYADVVVAPLRIARGIQNKVLEAMAMAKPIVATSMAMEGIPGRDDLLVNVADVAAEFAVKVLAVLLSPPGLVQANREYVQQDFSWLHSGEQLTDFLEQRQP
jgi:sugar transferase (PEP-CTERM/EpsH1 system associated)